MFIDLAANSFMFQIEAAAAAADAQVKSLGIPGVETAADFSRYMQDTQDRIDAAMIRTINRPDVQTSEELREWQRRTFAMIDRFNSGKAFGPPALQRC